LYSFPALERVYRERNKETKILWEWIKEERKGKRREEKKLWVKGLYKGLKFFAGGKILPATSKRDEEEKTFFNQPDITDPLVGGTSYSVAPPLLSSY
jgi:hypothetical protein